MAARRFSPPLASVSDNTIVGTQGHGVAVSGSSPGDLDCEICHYADIQANRVSVITPVGAGLIGMAAGQEIDWPCPDGRPRKLRILRVRRPATGIGNSPADAASKPV